MTLDPDTEVIATLGSKEGFANLAQAITAPGDVMLVPNPAIRSTPSGSSSRVPRSARAGDARSSSSRRWRARSNTRASPLALVVNYPSNPTAQMVGLDFYKEVVGAREAAHMWVLSDLAYAEIYFDDRPAALDPAGRRREGPRGRIQLAVEDLRHARLAHGVRRRQQALIAALARVKSYLDYGAYTPIQVAATAALNGPQDCSDEMRAIYKPRRDVLVDARPRRLGDPGAAGVHVRLGADPGAIQELGSLEFAKLLIEAEVAVSPGIGFGEYGEGMCASRSLKTSSASARPRATSAASSDIGRKSCTKSPPGKPQLSRPPPPQAGKAAGVDD